MSISVTPLQGDYSGALLTPARLKRKIFRSDIAMLTEHKRRWNKRSAKDSPFQREGPITEKARFCLVVMRAKGTMRKPCSLERRKRQPGTPKID